MKVLITGSEGFFGSHLVERLVKRKHKLKCLVLYNSFNSYGWLDNLSKDVKKKIQIITGDIRDENIVKSPSPIPRRPIIIANIKKLFFTIYKQINSFFILSIVRLNKI